jgi:uncharacterized membrane protein
MIPVQHIHPMLVHFPIVFVFVLALFDVVATLRGATVTGRTTAGHVSAAIAVAAALSAILAMVFGGMALSHAEAGGFSSDIAEIHEGLGEAVAITLGLWAAIRAFLWWRDMRLSGFASAVVPSVAVIGAVLVTATAYFGGELVYQLGVNVTKVASLN